MSVDRKLVHSLGQPWGRWPGVRELRGVQWSQITSPEPGVRLGVGSVSPACNEPLLQFAPLEKGQARHQPIGAWIVGGGGVLSVLVWIWGEEKSSLETLFCLWVWSGGPQEEELTCKAFWEPETSLWSPGPQGCQEDSGALHPSPTWVSTLERCCRT